MSARTILYVEDNEVNRKIVRDLLRRTSYRLIEAHDGEAGVAIAHEQRPDLILMDVQLPKLSGIDAMRALRQAPGTAHTPIIAITSFAHLDEDGWRESSRTPRRAPARCRAGVSDDRRETRERALAPDAYSSGASLRIMFSRLRGLYGFAR
jgi:two-component system, cell cycle response regulator DivK